MFGELWLVASWKLADDCLQALDAPNCLAEIAAATGKRCWIIWMDKRHHRYSFWENVWLWGFEAEVRMQGSGILIIMGGMKSQALAQGYRPAILYQEQCSGRTDMWSLWKLGAGPGWVWGPAVWQKIGTWVGCQKHGTRYPHWLLDQLATG